MQNIKNSRKFEKFSDFFAAPAAFLCVAITCSPLPASADTLTNSAITSISGENIKLNQIGFLPNSHKLAVVPNGVVDRFKIVKTDSDIVVMSGHLTAARYWSASEETVKLADFSSLVTPGKYKLRIDGLADSIPFVIAPNAYKALNASALKAFYYNRASLSLPPKYAGVYARREGHPDTHVLIHSSAASSARPESTVISAPKGWYDAGDYNKYVVNSGITTYTLLAAYEHFPAFFKAQNVNIPESGNGIPDILNEAMWNLEWMLSMQDPNDGGVYHKLTNKNFDPLTVMPDRAVDERYVVQKTTAAALDFAAVMATASRVLHPYEDKLPAGLPARMLRAAQAAWKWAQANPAVLYKNPSDIRTGSYDDSELSDEFSWAAAELYIATRNDDFYSAIKTEDLNATVPSWSDVGSLALISLAQNCDHLSARADCKLITNRIDGLAATLLAVWDNSAYGVSMQKEDFIWGGNGVALNQAMILIQAYRLSGRRDYLNAAQSVLDYVLGRNAIGMSFVTGYGYQSPQHPHHRISIAGGNRAPIPGMVVGGPQPGQQDKAGCSEAYPSSIPAISYLDNDCSYASNEVAINWDAPLVYVSAAIQALTAP